MPSSSGSSAAPAPTRATRAGDIKKFLFQGVGSKCKPLKDTIEKAKDEVSMMEAAGKTDTRKVEQASEKEAKHKREKASQKAGAALKKRQEESAKKRRFSCHSSPPPSSSPRHPAAMSDADALRCIPR